MGISGLLPFLKNASRPVHVKEFQGQTAAIDVYCWLHKGAFGCAEHLVQGKPTDAYVKYVMKYVDLLLYFDIKPILVFDGRNLPSKSETEKKRRENRKANREKAVELLSQGRSREAREYFQRCVDITHQMARDVIVACTERNIDCIVAPYEADAQLAYLSRTVADLVITEDSDLTLFGCDKIIFKLTPTGDGNLYEKSRLNEVFGNLAPQFDFEKFRKMCIMSGCDYLPSLPGIGLAKAKQFWSKITNPNDKVVLPKMPHYLKLPALSVTQSYIDGFIQANNTFLYQIVFDPQTRKERPLTDYRVDVEPGELHYCGKFSDTDTALQLALGNLDIHSLRQINRYDPDSLSFKQGARYGSVAKHSSIWTKGYSRDKSHISRTNITTSVNSKSKQVVVKTSFSTPKQLRKQEIVASSTVVHEKRKLEAMTDEDVEKMLDSSMEEKPAKVRKFEDGDGPRIVSQKKMRVSSEEGQNGQHVSSEKGQSGQHVSSEKGQSGQHIEQSSYTRVLGDNKIQVKNTTVSRYFGASKVDTNKAKSAGTWFSSISTSANTEDHFIYDTDHLKDNEVKATNDETVDSECPTTDDKSILSDISNSHTAADSEKATSRNPFAIKRPLFDKKDRNPSDLKSEEKNEEVSDNQIEGDDYSPNGKFEESPDNKVKESPTRVFNHSRQETSPVISSKSSKPLKSSKTLPASKSSSILAAFARTPKPLTAPASKSANTSPTGSSAAGMRLNTASAVRPSGLVRPGGGARSKSLGGSGGGIKVGKPGPNQPTLTSLFARQEKRANV